MPNEPMAETSSTDPKAFERCTAIAYTNKAERLIVRCQFPAGHRGSHLEPEVEQ